MTTKDLTERSAASLLQELFEKYGYLDIYIRWISQAKNPYLIIPVKYPAKALGDNGIFKFWDETKEGHWFWEFVYEGLSLDQPEKFEQAMNVLNEQKTDPEIQHEVFECPDLSRDEIALRILIAFIPAHAALEMDAIISAAFKAADLFIKKSKEA